MEAEQQRAERRNEEDVEEVAGEMAKPRPGIHGVRGAEAGPLEVRGRQTEAVVLRLRVSHVDAIMTIAASEARLIPLAGASRPVSGTECFSARRHRAAMFAASSSSGAAAVEEVSEGAVWGMS